MKALRTAAIVGAIGVLCGILTGLWIRAGLESMNPPRKALHVASH